MNYTGLLLFGLSFMIFQKSSCMEFDRSKRSLKELVHENDYEGVMSALQRGERVTDNSLPFCAQTADMANLLLLSLKYTDPVLLEWMGEEDKKERTKAVLNQKNLLFHMSMVMQPISFILFSDWIKRDKLADFYATFVLAWYGDKKAQTKFHSIYDLLERPDEESLDLIEGRLDLWIEADRLKKNRRNFKWVF